MDAEDDLDNGWLGYDPRLLNGNQGSLRELDIRYREGQLNDQESMGINLQKTINIDDIHHVDPDRNPLEEERKVLYVNSARAPYPSGTSIGAHYFGGSKGGRSGMKKVSDSAVLIVDNQPPLENLGDLEEVRSILIGDDEDQSLEGKNVAVKTYPFMESFYPHGSM